MNHPHHHWTPTRGPTHPWIYPQCCDHPAIKYRKAAHKFGGSSDSFCQITFSGAELALGTAVARYQWRSHSPGSSLPSLQHFHGRLLAPAGSFLFRFGLAQCSIWPGPVFDLAWPGVRFGLARCSTWPGPVFDLALACVLRPMFVPPFCLACSVFQSY